MKECVIMRGIPGSGKTRLLMECYHEHLVVSADHFRYHSGKYVFNKEENGTIHNKCLIEFLNAVQRGFELLAVDNTNSKVFEFAPYYRIAEAFGYDVKLVYVVCDPSMAVRRNVHNVPEEVIRTMANNFDPVPGGWKQIIVPAVITTE